MVRLGQRLNNIAALLLVVVLAWAPLPLGSNRPWAWHLLGVLAGIVLLLRVLGSVLARERCAVPPALGLAGVLGGAAAIWAWLQSVPGILPAEWNHPFWAEVAETGLPVRPIVGLSAEATRDALARVLTYAALFVTAWFAGRDRAWARRLLLTIFATGVLYAVYGLVVHLGRLEFIIPSVERLQYGRLHGSFVNPNHFATYLVLAFLAGVGLLLAETVRSADSVHVPTLLARLIDGLFGRQAWLLVGSLLLFVAILLTGSRGGFLALASGFVTLIMLLFLRARPRPATATALFAFLLLAAWGVLRLSGELTLARLDEIDRESGVGGGGRLAAYTLALDMIAERPWLGHGYGAFEQAFMLHRNSDFDVVYDRLHNTWLELAVELGLPAAFAVYAAMMVLFLRAVRGVFRRRHRFEVPLVGAAAAVAAGTHALVDFSLQIPAVAATFATLLGLSAAQAERPRSSMPADAEPHLRGDTVATRGRNRDSGSRLTY